MNFDKEKFRMSYSLSDKMNLRVKTILIIFLISLLILIILINSFFINTNDITTNFQIRNSPPSLVHLFGTDWMGRDMFTRTIKGLGLSIFIGAFASILSAVIAIILTMISSLGKYFDAFVSSLTDLFLSIPQILLIIMISITFGGGFLGIIVGISLTHWISLTRVLRAEVKQINTSIYIKISKNLGKSKWWIGKKHLLPLLFSQIIIGTILSFPHAIMHEAAVSFLGFGLSPHEPSIGIILSESMKYLSIGAWWLAFFPGITLLIIVLLFDIVGENIWKLLDPETAHK
jgi:peptide/nickel transport system permease protein